MGGLIDKLTKPGLDTTGVPMVGANENWGGGSPGGVKFFNSPTERAMNFADVSRGAAQPSIADVSGTIPYKDVVPTSDLTPGPVAAKVSTGMQSVDQPSDTSVSYDTPESKLPRFLKPTYKEATTDQNGLPASSPATTKLGKFMQIMTAAAKGGLAGQAASEQTVAASGGHRSGGVGTGFEAGLQEPYREAGLQQGAEQGAIQNQIGRAQIGLLPFKRLQAQAELSKTINAANKEKFVTPRNGGVYDTTTGNFAPGTEPQDKIQNQSPLQVYADTVKDRMGKGLTGPQLMADPQVQSALQALQATQKEGKPDNLDQQYLDAASKGDTATMGNIEKAWHAKASNTHITVAPPTTVMPEIKPNTPQYRVAQDLAYGKLGMQGFRSLTAYSRDTGTKMAIYDMAGKLNPNFNPQAFEMGFTLAKNPKVQQQLASLDNVVQAMPDLITASDQATRTGIPLLNKIVLPAGGLLFGGKKYSNFRTAQIAFADELSGALGYGSATDMSRDMGFNMTDPNLRPEQFSDALQSVVGPFIQRKRATLLNQMGIYGQPGMNPAADAPKPGAGNKGGTRPPLSSFEH